MNFFDTASEKELKKKLFNVDKDLLEFSWIQKQINKKKH